MSVTNETSLISSRTHAQGEAELCWLYDMSTSLRKSIQILRGIGLTLSQVKDRVHDIRAFELRTEIFKIGVFLGLVSD